jgi:peptide/nickel transport system permease protein
MIPTMLGITIMVFSISRLAPGDPVSMLLGPEATLNTERGNEIREAQMRQYGLDKPIPVQYLIWLKHIIALDFGQSFKHHRPVIELIRERLPITVSLNLIAFTIIYIVSIPLGVTSALNHKGWFDRGSSLVLFILWSLPTMWAGQMMIGYLCSPEHISWFPPSGLSGNNADTMAFFPWLADRIWHIILPVTCMTYTGFAYLTKLLRAGMLDNLRMDYIRTAKAKGLSTFVVIFRHALRNSIIPIITIMAAILPAMFGGSLIIEKIFTIPGMGLLAFEAVTTRDYNVIMAVATIAGVLNLTGLLLADIAYALVDPRISFEGGE